MTASAPFQATSPRDLLDARRTVVIEAVSPEVDAGRFPIKRTVGEGVIVEADIFAEGHGTLAAVLKHRHESAPDWTEVPMKPLVNDRRRSRHHTSCMVRVVTICRRTGGNGAARTVGTV